MTNQHPSERGRTSAEARIDQDGVEFARSWLAERIADSTKPALDPRYIAAYMKACNDSER